MNTSVRIKGALFDVDGTLVLSNEAHAQAWVEAFASFGITVPIEHVRPLIGMGGDKLVPALAPALSSDTGMGKEIAERHKQCFLSEYVPTLRPAPGARDLCLHLRDQGLQLSTATSANAEELSRLLEIADVKDVFEAKGGSDDKDSKPSSDVVVAALARIRLKPEEVIMVGDTPYDIESARKCGIRTIAVRCGGWDDARLRDAIAIYDDPADLLARYWESPFGRAAGPASSDGPR
ncbi:MAG: hydrolase [Candidatus Eremiobacter antarcticus]|nr:MAG: hydrolase [Candidatus Eremiobacter sp. RRmetagenome_bin22]